MGQKGGVLEERRSQKWTAAGESQPTILLPSRLPTAWDNGRLMNPQQYVQEKAAASGSSFYYAFLFLPKQRRAALPAYYAFSRAVVDVVGEASDTGAPHTKLAWSQAEADTPLAGGRRSLRGAGSGIVGVSSAVSLSG